MTDCSDGSGSREFKNAAKPREKGQMEFDIRPVRLNENKDRLILLDQTKLPGKVEYIKINEIHDVWDAIKALKVRGAPAIGVAAAYGLYLSVKDMEADDFDGFYSALEKNSGYLASSRPTAVNLFWALSRMKKRALIERDKTIEEIKVCLLNEAELIEKGDEDSCRSIGERGLSLLKPGMTLLTHCNAGCLATSRYGTALAPIYLGKKKGYNFKVFADETRPLLQGARLTAWELMQSGIDVTLICDSMASMVMSQGRIDAVLVGCDRVAANGDTANKIGTLSVAVNAKEFGIPFYVLGPASTIDLSIKTGKGIKIEERNPQEVTNGFGVRTAPCGVKVYNPAFDVTDARYITAIITDRGIVHPPFESGLKKLFEIDGR